jgi:hypothetical protein
MGRSKLTDGARQKLTVVAKDRHNQRAAAARNQREGFILAPIRDDGRGRSEHLGIVHRARLVGTLDLEQRRTAVGHTYSALFATLAIKRVMDAIAACLQKN